MANLTMTFTFLGRGGQIDEASASFACNIIKKKKTHSESSGLAGAITDLCLTEQNP